MPDMRNKVKEYINELQTEIDRCINILEEDKWKTSDYEVLEMKIRIETLSEVQNDLKNRLDELV